MKKWNNNIKKSSGNQPIKKKKIRKFVFFSLNFLLSFCYRE